VGVSNVARSKGRGVGHAGEERTGKQGVGSRAGSRAAERRGSGPPHEVGLELNGDAVDDGEIAEGVPGD
jgi:hypothetical protein